MEDRIEKISKVGRSGETQSADEVSGLDSPVKNIEVNKDHFESLMAQERKQPQVQAVAPTAEGSKPSLMDAVTEFNKKVDTASQSSPKNIAVQANELIAELENLKTKLATPDLEIKSSVQTLIRSKLSHIDESLKIALNKAGVEYTAPTAQKNLATPIERFIGFITDAQAQLQGLGNDVERLSLKKGDISPASMLAIQYKMGIVQQQVELFANLLNQSLQSIKTVMNVQV